MKEERIISDALNKIVNLIKEPDLFYRTLKSVEKDTRIGSISYIYSNICMIIGEIMDSNIDCNWLKISYEYMIKIREDLYNDKELNTTSLFGGLSGIGYGVYVLNQNVHFYDKFLGSLNKIIIDSVNTKLPYVNYFIGNMKMEYYDTITGLAGTTAYLTLFKKEEEIEKTIKRILSLFVKITEDIKVLGYNVPGWYISSDNQFLQYEKVRYKDGNFNIGLSHGITGILSAMAIALKEGIEVNGQRQAMGKILKDLRMFYFEDEEGAIFWNKKISFENYITGKFELDNNLRASWCYGTPGIARSMFLAGKEINDKSSIDISIRAMKKICEMSEDKWMLNSPIFCHGYAGLLSIVQSMWIDTGNEIFNFGRKKILRKLLNFYDENLPFGFCNIEFKDVINNNFDLVRKNSVDILEGAFGVILALLSISNPLKDNWMRTFLLK